MSEALINPEILRWARKRAHFDHATIASKIGREKEEIVRWEEGEARPTFSQAEGLATALRIPFGLFFAPRPPEDKLPIPDLRTVGDNVMSAPSPDLLDVLTDVLNKQNWYRDFLAKQEVAPVPFIGRFRKTARSDDVAADITNALDLTVEHRHSVSNWEEFLTLLSQKAEKARVWVMRSGIVGSNTHRVLDPDEFRGFAISDELAPLVFINGSDAKAAQIFTLMHELAHLWLGASGVSDLSLRRPDASGSSKSIESVCNAVAAEVLVPKQLFLKMWRPDAYIENNARSLSRFFRVSGLVIVRRALDMGAISWKQFREYYDANWGRTAGRGDEGGGNYYRTLPVRNGKSFTEAVLRSALQQNLLLRDAGSLLGTKPAHLGRLASELKIA